jgi:signal transduction histidine kinase
VLTVSAGGAAAAPVTGLRLAIVRRLLELHGGRVTTLRADGRGPTLTVRMPRLA